MPFGHVTRLDQPLAGMAKGFQQVAKIHTESSSESEPRIQRPDRSTLFEFDERPPAQARAGGEGLIGQALFVSQLAEVKSKRLEVRSFLVVSFWHPSTRPATAH